MSEVLDLSAQKRAIAALERALRVYEALPASENSDLHEAVRSGVVQSFEVAFEVSWKMLRRRLVRDAASRESVAALSYRDLMREGAARGFIEDPQAWFLFREARNVTSHTYDPAKALQVLSVIPHFLSASTRLLEALEAHHA